MVLNSLTLTHKCPLLFRFGVVARSSLPHHSYKAHVSLARVQISGLRPCSSRLSHSTNGAIVNRFGVSKRSFPPLGLNGFRVYSAADGGSGSGGGLGSSGGGNSGGGNEGSAGAGGGNGWSFLSWYLGLLAKYPVLTKAVTSAILTFMGDLICQLVIDQAPSLDLKRTLVFSFLGLALVGPALHFWYLYLSKLVTVPGASGAFMRLLLDQFGFAPMFIGIFLSTLVTLEGRPTQVVPKLQQEWFSAVLANWQLWIPFQFLNFLFVPQQFQVLAANVIALAWNVILSFKAHKEVLSK